MKQERMKRGQRSREVERERERERERKKEFETLPLRIGERGEVNSAIQCYQRLIPAGTAGKH